MQRIHILGICGTFMGGIALLARELGYAVSGCDSNVYPPMSEQLAAAGIGLIEGYDPASLPDDALIVIGNALSRGNPAVEAVLDRGLPYVSGPQWLGEQVLAGRRVLAVSGTHGKTSVSSMLAWILDHAGASPGFLIGGVAKDFGVSARLGAGECFVVEADEYDTAFFDKRAKFLHYRPRSLIINNLEFDHADIYPDLAAIQRQFHHLLRCVPGSGRVYTPLAVPAIEETMAMGCWTPRLTLGVEGMPADGAQTAGDAPGAGGADAAAAHEGRADWQARLLSADGARWSVSGPPGPPVAIEWEQRGRHNVANGVAALAAAVDAGVSLRQAAQALACFAGVRRRLDLRGEIAGVRVYDDFAHHPTAIRSTLEALCGAPGRGRVLAVIEPRSNTMRMGRHREALSDASRGADRVFWYQPSGLDWSLEEVVAAGAGAATLDSDLQELVARVVDQAQSGDDIVVMSNGGFGGVHEMLLAALANRP